MSDVAIFTIGHSNHSFAKLAKLLQKNSIQVLVDVRSRPQSRWVPWFNQKNLESAIPGIGLEYHWAGDHLGGLPSDPAYYKPNPKRRKQTDPLRIVDYAKVARQSWFQEAIGELLEAASHRRTAVMCAEENPENCHRAQLIGNALVKRGARVMHIRKGGALEPQSATDHTTTA